MYTVKSIESNFAGEIVRDVILFKTKFLNRATKFFNDKLSENAEYGSGRNEMLLLEDGEVLRAVRY